MSINIPEIVAPSSLFTSTESLLSVGSLPNGDDTLIIDGVTGNFRAYQPASAGAHYSTDPAEPMTIVFWCNPNSSGSSGTNNVNPDGLVMGVMDSSLAAANTTTTSTTTGFAWAVSLGSSSHTRNFVYHRATAASSRNNVRWVHSAGMVMYAIRDPGNGAPIINCNGLNNPSSTNVSAAGTQGTPGALSSPNFAIGPYATGTGWRFPPAVVTLSKIGIWIGTLLTNEELMYLYESMFFGPPSP